MTTESQDLTDKDAHAALARLCEWEGLIRSVRLRGVLTYLVNEALTGRGSDVKAKTIGMDVYGYSVDELSERESVVRVDVGRLRRKLEEYYLGDGAADPVRFALPKGSYSLSIETHIADTGSDAPPNSPRDVHKVRSVILGLGLMIAVAIIGFLSLRVGFSPSIAPDVRPLERSAIFDASPGRLRAVNLAEVGRGLIFPAMSPGQLDAAKVTFEAAITADPGYFGGYAGASQVFSSFALLAPDAERKKSALTQSKQYSAKANELAPGTAWALSSKAWLAFVNRDYKTATLQSKRAVELAPNDPHIFEFDALISLYAGDFLRVISESKRMESLVIGSPGFVFRNAAGSALYHIGDYEGSIEAFEKSIADGGPVGPPALAYMMAAYQKLGRTDRAKQLALQYAETWPNTGLDEVLYRLFADENHANEVISAMRGAGWTEN